MRDRTSLMLDTMINAVDNGFSYDGIVSIPETGLEDVYRTGLAGWFDDSKYLLREKGAAISRAAARIFGFDTKGPESPIDSGSDPGGNDTPEVPPAAHPDSPSTPDNPPSPDSPPPPSGEENEDHHNAAATLPRKKHADDPRLPRKRTRSEEDKEGGQVQSDSGLARETRRVSGDAARQNVGLSSSKHEEVIHLTRTEETLAKKNPSQPRLADPTTLPRKRDSKVAIFPEKGQPRKEVGDEEKTGGGPSS